MLLSMIKSWANVESNLMSCFSFYINSLAGTSVEKCLASSTMLSDLSHNNKPGKH